MQVPPRTIDCRQPGSIPKDSCRGFPGNSRLTAVNADRKTEVGAGRVFDLRRRPATSPHQPDVQLEASLRSAGANWMCPPQRTFLVAGLILILWQDRIEDGGGLGSQSLAPLVWNTHPMTLRQRRRASAAPA